VPASLDSALKERLRAVLADAPVTEAELRKLFDEGRACALILRGQAEKEERRLASLAAEPASDFVEIAAALRRVGELRPDVAELEELLDDLRVRAREFRASWLSLDAAAR
jgi:hypothetical protein